MKHKKGKSTISFKFLQNRIPSQLHTQTQNSLKTELEQKIDLLRLPVYNKKSKKKLFTNSKKFILPPKETFKKEHPSSEKREKKEDGRGDSKCSIYRYKKMNKTSYENILSRKTYNKTVNDFQSSKKKGLPNKDKNYSQQQEEKQPQKQKQSSQFYQIGPKAKLNENQVQQLKYVNYRDSQSLLRKSSLYLSSFVKRKQKQIGGQAPHIGYIPNVTANMKITFSPKKQRREDKEQARKRKDRKSKKQISVERIFNNMPIDPW